MTRRRDEHFDSDGVPSIPAAIASKLMRDNYLNDDDLAEADAAIEAAKAAIRARHMAKIGSHKTVGTLDRDVFPRRARSGE